LIKDELADLFAMPRSGPRIWNRLADDSITTMSQLLAKTPAELMRGFNFGVVSLGLLEGALAERGLCLGGTPIWWRDMLNEPT